MKTNRENFIFAIFIESSGSTVAVATLLGTAVDNLKILDYDCLLIVQNNSNDKNQLFFAFLNSDRNIPSGLF